MSSSDEGTRKSETLGKRFQGGCRAPFTPTPLLTLNHQEPDSWNHWKSITCLATYRQRPDRKTLVQNKLTWGLSSQNTRKFRRAWKVSRILPRFEDGLVFPCWFIVSRLKTGTRVIYLLARVGGGRGFFCNTTDSPFLNVSSLYWSPLRNSC